MATPGNISCAGILNGSSSADVNITDSRLVYERVFVFYTYGLPTICICGFLGNVLNLIILAGKRVQRMLRSTEKSASLGLIALAVADLSFCVSAFPSTFLPENNIFVRRGFLLYYACYCAAVINIFIMTSTWLTVTMSTERYLAIRHPLKSRNLITLRRSKVVIVLVFILSTVFNVPVFWRYTIEEIDCEGSAHYHVIPRGIQTNFDQVYQSLWAAIGNFVPLVMLLWCNIGLMREIHASYALRKQMDSNAGIHSHQANKDTHRITLTLLAIVLMFLILVAPSEVMKQVASLLGGDYSRNYTYRTIEVIYNLLQTINFSANFILYCIINPSFRKTMREIFCFQYKKISSDAFETSFLDATYKARFSSSLRMNNTRGHSKAGLQSPPRQSKREVPAPHLLLAAAEPHALESDK